MDKERGTLAMRVLIPRAALEQRVAALAAEIDRDYSNVPLEETARQPSAAPGQQFSAAATATGQKARPPEDPLIVIGVLKGSVFFLSDLLKQVTVPVAVDFFQTSSYGGAGTNRGEVRIRKDIDLSIRGRDVLLIEDIVDTGYTVRTILDLLRFRGARSVRLCALLDKVDAREIEVPVDYRGFAIENAFVVGYGLDYGERFRNLSYIAVWEEAADQSAAVPSPC
ncbi:MAG TPA: hypoxanthine phosphoribosyltransferase [Thermoanaerobaculia bacterium]|nr:hypoxanthine phosphoribosyltransferase [Thermoanaerobaculia bacterium]